MIHNFASPNTGPFSVDHMSVLMGAFFESGKN